MSAEITHPEQPASVVLGEALDGLPEDAGLPEPLAAGGFPLAVAANVSTSRASLGLMIMTMPCVQCGVQ